MGEYKKSRIKQQIQNSKIYHIVKPVITLYQEYKAKQVFVKHVKLDDIFLIGHPKSGNTWMAYLLAIIRNKDCQAQINLKNIRMHVPFIHGRDHHIVRHSHLPQPRIFRNEWPMYPEYYPKVIYLIRDPRAALLSLWHMYKIQHPDHCSRPLDDFIDEYLIHGCIKAWEPRLTRWDKQVSYWVERSKTDSRIIIIKYEEMVKDLSTVIQRVVKHVGIPCGDQELRLVKKRGSFASMRETEQKFGAEAYPGDLGKGGYFIRRGNIKSWEDEVPVNIVKKIEAELGGVMKTVGYLSKA